MSNLHRVLIIAGGLTHERDVSVRSGRRVANILHQNGHDVYVSDLDHSLFTSISSFAPDVIWPLVHGSVGEDGSLQALLNATGIPYVGSFPAQASLASNKPTAKTIVSTAGIHTPEWVSFPQTLFRQLGATQVLNALEPSILFPVVVKPTDGGSALGISRADNPDELRAAMVDAFAYGERVMIEKYVSGRDVAVSILELADGPHALPPVEIVTDTGKYDYDARYTTDSAEYFVPARFDDAIIKKISCEAVKVHSALGLRHLSRIDMIVSDTGEIFFIEANVTPGMTDTSLFPQAADAASSFSDICEKIISFTLEGTSTSDTEIDDTLPD